MKLEKLRISECNELMRGWEQGRCGSRLLKRPFRHSMTEGGTHCNVAGHVVPGKVVSWLPPRCSALRGTTPGAVRDRVAPHHSTPTKLMPTVHEDHAGEGDVAAGAA